MKKINFYNLNLEQVTLFVFIYKNIENILFNNKLIKRKRFRYFINALIFETIIFKNKYLLPKIFKNKNTQFIKKIIIFFKNIICCNCFIINNFLIK